MNWNVNFWTLLFAFSFGALLITLLMPSNNRDWNEKVLHDLDEIKTMVASGVLKAKKNPCDTVQVIDLPPQEFVNGILNYLLYQKGELKVDNPDVMYFHLPRCELDQILKDVGPGGDVKAYMAVKPNPANNGRTNMLTLFMTDEKVGSDGKNTRMFGEDDGMYDFVEPCPTLCGN